MAGIPLIAAAPMRLIPTMLDEMDIDPRSIIRRAGFPENLDAWETEVVSQRQYHSLLDLAAQAAGDPGFPALVGARMLGVLPVVREAVSRAGNVEEAMVATTRAATHLRQGAVFRTTLSDGRTLISQELDGASPEEAATLALAALNAVRLFIHARLGPEARLEALVLPECNRAWIPRIEEIFLAPVLRHPGPPHLIYPEAVLRQRFAPADDEPGGAAARLPLLMRSDDRLLGQLRRVIEGMLVFGDLSLVGAAHTLGIPARTLQSRLAELDLAFSDIVEEHRRTMAERYLLESDLKIADIAFLVGYDDASNFTRAFRRWHDGRSPRSFRQTARAATTSDTDGAGRSDSWES